MDTRAIISAFDKFLVKEGLTFEAVVIGGAALNLLRISTRETKDCDVLDPKIPAEIISAAEKFRIINPHLTPNWLNNGPDSLKRNLPPKWENRTQFLYKGDAIIFYTLGREDLLKTKLFAFCDRAIDLPDCLALAPTKLELVQALGWVQFQDANAEWPEHVHAKFKELARELGYEL